MTLSVMLSRFQAWLLQAWVLFGQVQCSMPRGLAAPVHGSWLLNLEAVSLSFTVRSGSVSSRKDTLIALAVDRPYVFDQQ